jgi:hypothetical protein
MKIRSLETETGASPQPPRDVPAAASSLLPSSSSLPAAATPALPTHAHISLTDSVPTSKAAAIAAPVTATPCKFFLLGPQHCTKGALCKFSHSAPQPQQQQQEHCQEHHQQQQIPSSHTSKTDSSTILVATAPALPLPLAKPTRGLKHHNSSVQSQTKNDVQYGAGTAYTADDAATFAVEASSLTAASATASSSSSSSLSHSPHSSAFVPRTSKAAAALKPDKTSAPSALKPNSSSAQPASVDATIPVTFLSEATSAPTPSASATASSTTFPPDLLSHDGAVSHRPPLSAVNYGRSSASSAQILNSLSSSLESAAAAQSPTIESSPSPPPLAPIEIANAEYGLLQQQQQQHHHHHLEQQEEQYPFSQVDQQHFYYPSQPPPYDPNNEWVHTYYPTSSVTISSNFTSSSPYKIARIYLTDDLDDAHARTCS